MFQSSTEQLQAVNHFHVSCIPEGADILLNVTGTSAAMSNMSLSALQPYAAKTLWNFNEAEQLSFSSVEVFGAVLAPNAQIAQASGSLDGSLIAQSFNGPMHIRWIPYAGQPAAFCAQ